MYVGEGRIERSSQELSSTQAVVGVGTDVSLTRPPHQPPVATLRSAKSDGVTKVTESLVAVSGHGPETVTTTRRQLMDTSCHLQPADQRLETYHVVMAAGW